MTRMVCLLVVVAVVCAFTGVALADQPDAKQWEIRIGLGHGSTFGTAAGSPSVNGIAGQIQWNFASNLFLQGTVLYEVATGNVPGGAFGFAIIGYRFPF